MKEKTTKIGSAALCAIIAICLALAFVPFLGSGVVKAYDGRPGEFGTQVGDPITVGDKTYVNYQGGYVFKDSSTNEEKHVGGKNVNAQGEAVMTDAVRDYIAGLDSFGISDGGNTEGAQLILGKDMLTEGTTGKADLINKFRDKYLELYQSGYNCGIPSSRIEPWGGKSDATMIKMDFRYGDGSADPDDGNGGTKNRTTLIYNTVDDTVRLLNTDKIYQKYGNENRRLGAPVTEVGKFNIVGKEGEHFNAWNGIYQAQIFETGVILIDNDGNAQKLECLPVKGESVSDPDGTNGEVVDTYHIYPVLKDQDIYFTAVRNNVNDNRIDINSTWHPLLTARAVTTGENEVKVYFNYAPGCVEVTYKADYTDGKAMVYAGYHFVSDGKGGYEKEILPTYNYTFKDDLLWQGISSDAVSMYRTYVENGTEEDLKNLFRDAYIDLANDGFVPGYRCSDIKIWDLIVLDFKFGDGTTGFNAVGSVDRERMTTFVYSPQMNKVYGVYSGYWAIWKDDGSAGRRTTGAPISKVLKNHTVGGTTFEEIQFFEKAYMYKKDGEILAKYGVTAKDPSTYAEFKYLPAPVIYEEYGAEKARQESEDKSVTYINYERAAITCRLNSNGTSYNYIAHPGRNFDFADNCKLNMLESDAFIGADGSKISRDAADTSLNGSGKGKWDGTDGIKAKIVAKYQECLANGFFPGFLQNTEVFKGSWNGVYALQLIRGDSTSTIFGLERPGVAAIVYNKNKDEVYLLADIFMDIWGGKVYRDTGDYWQVLKTPTSDAYTVAGNDKIKFQNFEGSIAGKESLLVMTSDQTFAVYEGDSNMTAEKYIEQLGSINFPEREEGDKEIGYDGEGTITEIYTETVSDGLPAWGWALIGVGIAIVVGGGAFAAYWYFKKIKPNQNKTA